MNALNVMKRAKIFGISILISVSISGGVAQAGTTTADFLTWERKAQEAFLQNAFSMTGVIASQAKPEIARCIDEWYFKDEATRSMRNNEILQVMPNLKDFRPTAVVLGIVNDVCGKF